MIAGYNKAKVIKKIYRACDERCKQNKKNGRNKMKTAVVFLADGFEDA